MKTINSRYQIKNMLLTNEYYQVYQVVDQVNGQEIELVMLTTLTSSLDFFERFKDYVHIYLTLKHPHICENYAFDVVETIDGSTATNLQYFYTRESYVPYLENRLTYLNFNHEETLRTIFALLRGVTYLHFRGYPVENINFENFVTYQESNMLMIKIKDYITLAIERFVKLDEPEYDSLFRSPESYWSEQPLKEADIYSLGKIIFYIFFKYNYREAKYEQEISRYFDNKIADLIRRMTEKEADERSNNVHELAMELASYTGYHYEFTDKSYYERIYPEQAYVQTNTEAKQISDILHQKMNYSTLIENIEITGDKGNGKTHLISEVAEKLRLRRVPYLFQRIEYESSDPYELFRSILKHLIDHENISYERIRPYAAELALLLPEISEKFNVINYGELAWNNMRINNRIVNFLASLALPVPVIIILDNIHRLHENELAILRQYLATANHSSLFFVYTVEDEENEFSKAFHQRGNLHHTVLRPLSYDQTTEFLQLMLGFQRRPTKFAAMVMSKTKGNKKDIDRFVHALFESGDIYIDDSRDWFMRNREDYINLNTDAIEKLIINEVEKLDEDYMTILKIIASFNLPFELTFFSKYTKYQVRNALMKVQELCDKNILVEKASETGYSYDFNYFGLKTLIYEKIEHDDRIYFHETAIDILEGIKEEYGLYINDILIEHYIKSEQYEAAAKYCVDIAKSYRDTHVYSQRVKYLKQAISINNDYGYGQHNDALYLEIAEIDIKLGRVHDAELNLTKAINISRRAERYIILTDSLAGMARVKMTTNHIDEVVKVTDELMEIYKEYKYLPAYFHYEAIMSRVYYQKQGQPYPIEKLEALLQQAKDQAYDKFVLVFLNELGISCIQRQSFDKSINYFKTCYDEAIKQGDSDYILKPLNNIGVIYLDEFGNYEKSREYFRKAIKVSEEYNIVEGLTIYFSNIGVTYSLEDNYEQALIHLNKAEEFALKTNDDNVYFTICLQLASIYTHLGEYLKAYNYLKKVESAFNLSMDRGPDVLNYYLTHAEFYLKIKNFEDAEQWLHDLTSLELDFDEYDKSKIEVTKYEIARFRKRYYSGEELFDISIFEEGIGLTRSIEDYKFLREAILGNALELIGSSKYIQLKELLALDEKLISNINSKFLQEMRAIILGVFEEDRKKYFLELLPNLRNKDNRWLVFKILGREYYNEEAFVEAIKYYIRSLDIIHESYMRVPNKYREKFLFYDHMKVAVRNQVSNARIKLLSESNYNQDILTDYEIVNANEFFTIEGLRDIFDTDPYLQNIKDRYMMSGHRYYESLEHVVEDLTSSDKQNIQTVIKYLKQLTHAEYGALYMYNNASNLSEVILDDPDSQVLDLDKYRRLKIIDEGILYNRFLSIGNYSFIDNLIEGLIILPVVNHISEYASGRRKYGSQFQPLGYIVLSTNDVFNNFTEDAFEKAKRVNQILYQLVDKYNLKTLSSIDQLTGVYLRSHFEEKLSQEIANAYQGGHSFSIIIGDIDKFKLVNDTYGHRKGDEVLKSIASVFTRELRDSDVVARYGGEEFIILLPTANENSSYEIAERLRHEVEATKIYGIDKPITISFGISTYPNHGETAEELIEKADQALYRSKDSGRNRTTLWNPEIGRTTSRFDKLTGIMTGNISNDSRTIMSLIDLIDLLRNSDFEGNRMLYALNIIMDISESKYGTLFLFDEEGQINDIFSKEMGKPDITSKSLFDEKLVRDQIDKYTGEYFVDWENMIEVNPINGLPSWRSIISMPLFSDGVKKGLLLLGVPIYEKEYDFNSFNLVYNIGPILATLL